MKGYGNTVLTKVTAKIWEHEINYNEVESLSP